MKRMIYLFIVCTVLFGCTKSVNEKALILLQDRDIITDNIELDSLIGYSKSFEQTLKAITIGNDADSILKKRLASIKEMKEDGRFENEARSLADRTKEELTSLYKTQMSYKQEAASINFRNEMRNTPKEFLGWKCIINTDSCTYTIYFDSDISKILGIDKEEKK